MNNITIDFSAFATIGLDLAKHVFQVHTIDAAGRVVTTRSEGCSDILRILAMLPHRLGSVWLGPSMGSNS